MSASRQSRAALVAAVFGLGLMAAPAAQAFSLQDSNGSTTDPRQGYLNLDTPQVKTDKPAAGFGNSDVTTYKQGGVTLHFGRPQRSFEQEYNTDRYFDLLGKPPGVR
jgi:hypothetical protein